MKYTSDTISSSSFICLPKQNNYFNIVKDYKQKIKGPQKYDSIQEMKETFAKEYIAKNHFQESVTFFLKITPRAFIFISVEKTRRGYSVFKDRCEILEVYCGF